MSTPIVAPPDQTAISLDTLRPGDRGVIMTVLGDTPVTQRLAEMGMVAGARVEMLRPAPFGDPLAIRLDDYLLSLRKAEAALVRIQRH